MCGDRSGYARCVRAIHNNKRDWPTQRVSFGFAPPRMGGWLVLNLYFAFPGGWIHHRVLSLGVGEVSRCAAYLREQRGERGDLLTVQADETEVDVGECDGGQLL